MTGDYPTDDLDPHDLGALLADRETLRQVTEELVRYKIAVGMVVRSWSPRTRRRIRDRDVAWVKVDLRSAAALLDASTPTAK